MSHELKCIIYAIKCPIINVIWKQCEFVLYILIDKNYKLFPNFHNYIIICKKEILDLHFQEMQQELIKLVKKGEKNEK